jgi:hypothetical protein
MSTGGSSLAARGKEKIGRRTIFLDGGTFLAKDEAEVRDRQRRE